MSTAFALRRERRSRPPLGAGISFLVSLLFGAATSGSLALARSAHGQLSSLGLITLAIIWASLLLVLTTELLVRSTAEGEQGAALKKLALAQLLGVALASIGAHLALESFSREALVESPGQFVNDAALALPILLVCWTGVMRDRRLASTLIVVTLAAVGLYAGTRALWHFDPFPGAGVQQFVLLEIACSCAALWVFDWVRTLKPAR